MFAALTDKLQGVFGKLSRQVRLTEDNISDAVRQVRLALLEADVNYAVTKRFVRSVKERALGDAVLKAVNPGQQFIKVVHDELVALMGKEEAGFAPTGDCSIVMMCGLQGAGKTTHCAKLARYCLKQGIAKKPLLIACDLQRPAAVAQLKTLGEQIGVEVFAGGSDAVQVAREGVAHGRVQGHDLIIIDTAGRLHIDEELMAQLRQMHQAVKPDQVLFVANATTGQDAVNTAAAFNEQLEIDGTILTMLDGNARGGAAISIVEVTGKPLLFEGIGEKVDDLQLFNPTSMADRILGMGDTINLVRKAQEHVDEEDAKQMEKKLRSASFSYEDYLSQMQSVKKMGSIKGLLKMIPGLGSKMAELPIDDKELDRVEAIILSMTTKERRGEDDLGMSRRRRIAAGSGTKIDDVNKLIKSFKQAKQFFKNMPSMNKLEKMMGGASWR